MGSPALAIHFLGTGPSGGRPGRGRSRRRESSVLVRTAGASVLVDVTRDFAAQSSGIDRVDLVLLTHPHRDAAGGLAAFDHWLAERQAMVHVMASPRAIAALRRRLPRAGRLAWTEVAPGAPRRRGGVQITALEVPHAPGCTTYAWRLRGAGKLVVYASDVARLTPALRRFSAGADLLVIDGAMWGRTLYTHLTIQAVLPELARWPVARLLFTQIGRSSPSHEALEAWLRRRCPRAGAAYDGLVVRLSARPR